METNREEMVYEDEPVSAEYGLVKEVHSRGLLVIVLYTMTSVLLEHNLSQVVSFIVSMLVKASKEEITVDNEIRIMKKTQQSVSMTDEFAKHAKLQRQINKLQKMKDSYLSQRNMKGFQIRIFSPIGLHILRAMISSYIVYSYWNIPLVLLSENWIGPFYLILAMPCGVEGGIGVVFLMLVLYLTIRTTKKRFSNWKIPAQRKPQRQMMEEALD